MKNIINLGDMILKLDNETKILLFKRSLLFIILKAINDSDYNLALLRPNHTKIIDTDNENYKVMLYCTNYEEIEDEGEISTIKCNVIVVNRKIITTVYEDKTEFFGNVMLKVDIEVPDYLEIKDVSFEGELFEEPSNLKSKINFRWIRTRFYECYVQDVKGDIDPDEDLISNFSNKLLKGDLKGGLLKGFSSVHHKDDSSFYDTLISPCSEEKRNYLNLYNKFISNLYSANNNPYLNSLDDIDRSSIYESSTIKTNIYPSFLKKKEDDNNESNESDIK